MDEKTLFIVNLASSLKCYNFHILKLEKQTWLIINQYLTTNPYVDMLVWVTTVVVTQSNLTYWWVIRLIRKNNSLIQVKVGLISISTLSYHSIFIFFSFVMCFDLNQIYILLNSFSLSFLFVFSSNYSLDFFHVRNKKLHTKQQIQCKCTSIYQQFGSTLNICKQILTSNSV